MDGKKILTGVLLALAGMVLSGCMAKKISVELPYGEQYEIQDETLSQYENLTYEVEDETVIALQGCQANAVGPGKTTVMVKDGDTIVETYDFTVEIIPITGIVLATDHCELVEEEHYQLGYTLFPADASEYGLTWLSADESVATVTPEGVITGVGAGDTTVTVSTEDGLLEKCHVSVAQKAAYERLNEEEKKFVDTLMTCIYDFKAPSSVRVTAIWGAIGGKMWSFRATAQNSYGGSNTSSYFLMEDTLIKLTDDYEVPDSEYDLELINQAIQEKLLF